MFSTEYTKPNLYPMGANFDRMFEELFETSFKDAGVSKYPATDVYAEDGVTHIEIAVTGFSDKDIEVSLEDDILIIKGSKQEKEQEDRNYHTKNIARRSFIRKFTLSGAIENVLAEIKNGILHLELVQRKKEETKKVIKINKKDK